MRGGGGSELNGQCPFKHIFFLWMASLSEPKRKWLRVCCISLNNWGALYRFGSDLGHFDAGASIPYARPLQIPFLEVPTLNFPNLTHFLNEKCNSGDFRFQLKLFRERARLYNRGINNQTIIGPTASLSSAINILEFNLTGTFPLKLIDGYYASPKGEITMLLWDRGIISEWVLCKTLAQFKLLLSLSTDYFGDMGQ